MKISCGARTWIIVSIATFFNSSVTLWHPGETGQGDVPRAAKQMPQTLWPVLHTILMGGRRYFVHLEHRNWSKKVSGRAGISSSGFLASFDIASDQLFTLLIAIIILERVTICRPLFRSYFLI